MKPGDIIEWAVVDEFGNTFAYRKTRREARELRKRLDPRSIRGFRIAKVEVVR
jgi:hypothetical protein